VVPIAAARVVLQRWVHYLVSQHTSQFRRIQRFDECRVIEERNSIGEMLRLTVDLSDEDIDVLALIYSVQGDELKRTGFLPEQNLANSTWRDLQSKYPLFKSSKIHSICAKLQSLGMVAQVERIATTLDLTSIPYAVLEKGADYLEAVGRHDATAI